MKKKKQMTLEEHQKIAAWLTDPIVIRMVCDIPNTYGKTSRAGRYARKLSDAVMHLKSEMENMAYADGHSDVATGLYYPANDDVVAPARSSADFKKDVPAGCHARLDRPSFGFDSVLMWFTVEESTRS